MRFIVGVICCCVESSVYFSISFCFFVVLWRSRVVGGLSSICF